MTDMNILEAVGGVDEALLLESERFRAAGRRKPGKLLLIAAIIGALVISAGAAYFIGVEIDGGSAERTDIIMKQLDAQWDLAGTTTVSGYRLDAQIEVYDDVSLEIRTVYMPRVPEGWVRNGGAAIRTDGVVSQINAAWRFEQDGSAYDVFFRQESADFYLSRDEKWVDILPNVPTDETVTGRVEQIGSIEVFRVTVPPIADSGEYAPGGETRLYWSDGYSIFKLVVPLHMTDTQLEELIHSLETVGDIDAWFDAQY